MPAQPWREISEKCSATSTSPPRSIRIQSLADGVDVTLIELMAEEIGDAEFLRAAADLSDHTFAAHKLPAGSANTLHTVFVLRAQRLIALRADNKIAWLKGTGAKVRLQDFVELNMLPSRVD